MRVAKIRLRKPSRVFTIKTSEDLQLERRQACIVRSERGLEYGICVLAPEEMDGEVSCEPDMSIIRKATVNDGTTYQKVIQEQAEFMGVCAKKIAERNLPMKLVDAELTFDRRKIVFFFTAEERVDFRDLVRDLAHDLKMRIELCHIQVRDEAKIVGGIGPCGKELCCRLWLPDFIPISMKMAKRQNLSLNPEKISGQCGRLLCCLSYENELYEDPKKRKAREKAEEIQRAQEGEAQPERQAKAPSPDAAALGRLDEDIDTGVDRSSRKDTAKDRGNGKETRPQKGTEPQSEARAEGEDKPRKKRRRRRRKKKSGGEGDKGSSAGSEGQAASRGGENTGA